MCCVKFATLARQAPATLYSLLSPGPLHPSSGMLSFCSPTGPSYVSGRFQCSCLSNMPGCSCRRHVHWRSLPSVGKPFPRSLQGCLLIIQVQRQTEDLGFLSSSSPWSRPTIHCCAACHAFVPNGSLHVCFHIHVFVCLLMDFLSVFLLTAHTP